MFRMANVRANQIVEAQVHVLLARSENTIEGEDVWRFYDLELRRDRNATFRHSWTVVHPIGTGSPLYGATRGAMAKAFAEIVVLMTGIDGVFMQTVYARHTYDARDILWGARLTDIMVRSPQGEFAIDYGKFDDVIKAGAPDGHRRKRNGLPGSLSGLAPQMRRAVQISISQHCRYHAPYQRSSRGVRRRPGPRAGAPFPQPSRSWLMRRLMRQPPASRTSSQRLDDIRQIR